MKDIEFIICTRFAENQGNNNIQLTEEWLNHRFNLFETYCFPSIQHQTDTEFKWILSFDHNIANKYKDKLINFKNILPNIYLEDKEIYCSYNYMQNIISLPGPSQYIIHLRLDNDDAIHKDMIKTLKENFISIKQKPTNFTILC